MPALGIGLGISGLFGWLGARSAAGGAREAAALQTQQALQGIDTLGQRVNEAGQVLNPFAGPGYQAIDSLTNEANSGWAESPLNQQFNYAGQNPEIGRPFTLADMQRDPGYQFRIQEGQRGLETSAAARGSLLSGGSLKALERYRQGFASNELDKAYGRFTGDQERIFGQAQTERNAAYNRFTGSQDRRFQQLYQLANLGASAASQRAGLLANAGGQSLGAYEGIGNAQGAGAAGAGAAYGGALGNFGNQIGQIFTLKYLLGDRNGMTGSDPTEYKKNYPF